MDIMKESHNDQDVLLLKELIDRLEQDGGNSF